MGRVLILALVVLLLAACGAPSAPTPDAVATQVAVAQAVAATLTAEAPAAMADLVATQVAAAKAAAATLTAEAPAEITPVLPAAVTEQPPARAEATAAPQPTQMVQQLRDLGRGLTLVAQETRDDSQPGFGYYAWAPLLMGPLPQVTDPFNRATEAFLNNALDEVRQGFVESAPEPGSSLWITHTLSAATEDLVSVLFYVDGYMVGAAHPFHYSYSLNYDLNEGRVLGLSDLFLPGSGYLDLLSSYSLEDLQRRGVLEWEEGALPVPENYQRWNITPEGLLISFDEYSVAPYAAGPQVVVVPYTVLADIIDPQGPLAPLVQ